MQSVGWRETDWTKPAPGTLGLVQDFVNTRNRLQGGDLLGDVGEADRRLAERGLLEMGESVEETGRRVLVDFREALRELLLAHNGASEAGPGLGILNQFAASAALGVQFGAGGSPTLGPVSGNGPAERVAAWLLAEVFRAEAEGRWERLKACRNPECRWVFYDASKNGLGRWCNMQVCGARHKMRRYRERKQSENR
jgi:predicted RNA-binding Zn ribbon-like protein